MANRNPVCDEIFTAEGLLCLTEEETLAAGRALAECVGPGVTLALDGPLGAGKTCFVKGLAEAMGENPGAVSSPTFPIVHEYLDGALVHLDLYRIESAAELEELGIEDSLSVPGVRVIEWAAKFPKALPASAWHLDFTIEGDFRRIRGSRPA